MVDSLYKCIMKERRLVMGDRMNKYGDFRKNPFVVPDNFFEKFNEEVIAILPQKQPRKVKFSIKKYVLPWVAVAAVMSGVVFTLKDTILLSPKMDIEKPASVNGVNFVSAEDRDFYLYLQDDAVNKELTTGSLAE
ncbi:MAG: hypothetical protein H6Q14_2327 [Bacteroidetes bacterium]|jgi:hypothetical protein|nr:hypothetical protein [Bacteroidota bacterium]